MRRLFQQRAWCLSSVCEDRSFMIMNGCLDHVHLRALEWCTPVTHCFSAALRSGYHCNPHRCCGFKSLKVFSPHEYVLEKKWEVECIESEVSEIISMVISMWVDTNTRGMSMYWDKILFETECFLLLEWHAICVFMETIDCFWRPTAVWIGRHLASVYVVCL